MSYLISIFKKIGGYFRYHSAVSLLVLITLSSSIISPAFAEVSTKNGEKTSKEELVALDIEISNNPGLLEIAVLYGPENALNKRLPGEKAVFEANGLMKLSIKCDSGGHCDGSDVQDESLRSTGPGKPTITTPPLSHSIVMCKMKVYKSSGIMLVCWLNVMTMLQKKTKVFSAYVKVLPFYLLKEYGKKATNKLYKFYVVTGKGLDKVFQPLDSAICVRRNVEELARGMGQPIKKLRRKKTIKKPVGL